MTESDTQPADRSTIVITTYRQPNGRMWSEIATELSGHEQVAILTIALAEALQKADYTPAQEQQMLPWIFNNLGIEVQARPQGTKGPFTNLF